MKNIYFSLSVLFLLFIFACKNDQKNSFKKYSPTNQEFKLDGRKEILPDNTIGLIGSASSIEFIVEGDSLNIFLQSQYKHGNSFTVVINDENAKRYRILGDSLQKFTISLPKQKKNKVGVFKATEAATGNLIFHGIEAENLLQKPDKKPLTIEFIGNSITCGAASDTEFVACNEGFYHDHHNAYLAYGPRVARSLEVNYFLSSVSGIGIYRNWNDENIEEPIMPQVYENLYLDANPKKPYDFNVIPDVVSICLGTNDLSTGDGEKIRLEFNAEKFIENYSEFIATIYKHYPQTKIVLLNSPMVSGEKNDILVACLKEIQAHWSEKNPVALFEFEPMVAKGCTGHPSVEDHKIIADQLTPFFKNIINKE
jgi:lysophospholipase L1-like esterase